MLNDHFRLTIGAMRHIYNRVVTEQQKTYFIQRTFSIISGNYGYFWHTFGFIFFQMKLQNQYMLSTEVISKQL